ncbi:methyltransferase [Aliikangiella sp. IMCC44653]
MLTDFQPLQSLNLKRFPPSSDKSLRAWSAADELLLEHLKELKISPESNILIVNDAFGALSVSLAHFNPTVWVDSLQSKIAIENNLSHLNLTKQVNFLEFTPSFNPQLLIQNIATAKPFDLVVMQVPKHNSLLTYQLAQLKQWLTPNAQIIATGMTKTIHNSNLQIFSKVIGTTRTSLAKKKARLIFSKYQNQVKTEVYLKSYQTHPDNLEVLGYPGVFSRAKLDLGAAVMLKHLPQLTANQNALDLGCGNGVLGATLAKRSPSANIYLADESFLAVASAKATFAVNKLSNGQFFHSDVLSQVNTPKLDVIVCNPPFHQQNVQTLSIAQKMFKQSAKALNSTGELRVVANRHLKYAGELKRLFHQVKPISNDPKFIVWQASEPRR